jgi:RNA polymerase sigma-70 factor, ECF subfamily
LGDRMIGQNYSYAPTAGSRRHALRREVPSGKSSEPVEAKTIRRAQQGDRGAFERIYRRHSPRIFGLCWRMVGNPTEAEDLTQEAFLQVFRKIQTFRGDSALYTWMHRLTVNVVFMHLRKKKLREIPLGESGKEDGQGRQQDKETGSPDLTLTQFCDRVHLEDAVDRLPTTCKRVFVLHEVQGYKHREIARIMESSVATSKVRLHRARARLRELLKENLQGLPGGCQAPAQGTQS